jgi:hypothetical protein
MTEQALRDEINKRFTLNWLIQGASEHAGMTLHHLVRDELNAVEPELLRLYDRFALLAVLQYWQRDSILLLGWPPRFWRRAASRRTHPFFGHPLLSRHGGTFAEAARRRALARANEKGLAHYPLAFSLQTFFCVTRLRKLEASHQGQLVELARKATSTLWGIPSDRLEGELTTMNRMSGGDTIPTRTVRGAVLRVCIMGLSRAVRRGDELMVVARGTNWLLLAKELVKGTAELICLHGLNQLSEEAYRHVIDSTDWLELEPWMLQSGGELWRQLLEAIPEDRPLSRVLMDLARLPARELESVMTDVIERPDSARERLAELAGSGIQSD